MATAQKIDLEGIVEQWSRDYFQRKANRKERRLLEKDKIMAEIDWKRVRFVHEEPNYEPKVPKVATGVLNQNVLFHTTFTNKTERDQTYNFKADRTTRSSCTVEVEEGYTKGCSMDITIKTPCEIMEANAGFHREISLVNIESNTVEEELAWGVNSEISVKGKHRAIAKLIITEEEYCGKFSIKTRARGRVRVIFTNIKDNNSFVRAVEGDINEIVRWARENKIIEGSTITVDGNTRSVVCVTKGSCAFKYGLKQDVEVDQVPINDL